MAPTTYDEALDPAVDRAGEGAQDRRVDARLDESRDEHGGDRLPDASGLEGVIAATTCLSRVDGARGELLLAGFPVEELAPRATVEEVFFLLWEDRLPTAAELDVLRSELAAARALPEEVLDLLGALARRSADPMDAVRAAVAALPSSTGASDLGARLEGARRDAVRVAGAMPSIVAAFERLRSGRDPVPPRDDLRPAEAFLHQLDGSAPSAERARALDTYLATVADHGLNASTFAARVVISTRSDLVSAVTAAIGALKGPLHGGAPGPVLETILEVGSPERAEAVLRAKLDRGERLMGFGHRVYRVRDPRADVLAGAAERFFTGEGAGPEEARLWELARAVETTALSLLRERKPDRRLETNVEFNTALLLHGIGLPKDLFTPAFAIGRLGGWSAHCLEQLATDRLIRPKARYAGALDRKWVPVTGRER